MRSKEVVDWAMCSHIASKYKALHQKAWLVERNNALFRSALQRAERRAPTESLCIGFVTVLDCDVFMHDALVSINDHAPYQALLGRQPPSVPSLTRRPSRIFRCQKGTII